MKKILIKEVYNPEKTIALIVEEEENFTNIVKKFVEEPYIRGLFVIDKSGRYLGFIKRESILQWAKIKLGDVSGLEEYIFKFSKETVAKHLIYPHSEKATISPEDDIVKCLRLMLSYDLTDIPVVDKNLKILGDVTIPELISKVLEVSMS
ncbi:MAG: CBS domain-containing protein [Nitrososphaerales archaeon]